GGGKRQSSKRGTSGSKRAARKSKGATPGSKRGVPGVKRAAPASASALRERVAALERELAEAREREAASGDGLRLTPAPPRALAAVLDGIVAGAVRLVGAEWGALTRFDGKRLHLVTQRGPSPEFLEMAAKVYPLAPHPDAASFRAMATRRPV